MADHKARTHTGSKRDCSVGKGRSCLFDTLYRFCFASDFLGVLSDWMFLELGHGRGESIGKAQLTGVGCNRNVTYEQLGCNLSVGGCFGGRLISFCQTVPRNNCEWMRAPCIELRVVVMSCAFFNVGTGCGSYEVERMGLFEVSNAETIYNETS